MSCGEKVTCKQLPWTARVIECFMQWMEQLDLFAKRDNAQLSGFEQTKRFADECNRFESQFF